MVGLVASFAIREVDALSRPARHAAAIGQTMVFGLDQLDPATGPQIANPFIERWRAAISFHLGAEEFEKFCAAGYQPDRGTL